MEQLADRTIIRSYIKGDTILLKASPIGTIQIVMEGECMTSDPANPAHKSRSYVRGMVFSTTALFNRSESNATEPLSVVVSSEEARMLCLEMAALAELEQPIRDALQALAIEAIVKETSVLGTLSSETRRDIASTMHTEIYRMSETIITQVCAPLATLTACGAPLTTVATLGPLPPQHHPPHPHTHRHIHNARHRPHHRPHHHSHHRLHHRLHQRLHQRPHRRLHPKSQGELGEHFYIILAGTCDVLKTKAGVHGQLHEATLSSGQYFGEMALVQVGVTVM